MIDFSSPALSLGSFFHGFQVIGYILHDYETLGKLSGVLVPRYRLLFGRATLGCDSLKANGLTVSFESSIFPSWPKI